MVGIVAFSAFCLITLIACGGRTPLQDDFTTPTDADIADTDEESQDTGTDTLDARPLDARPDVIVVDAEADSDLDSDQPLCPSYEVVGEALRITNSEFLSAEPDLVSDGHDFALVWDQELDNPDFTTAIFFTLISAEGELISDFTPLSDDTTDSRYPTIIWTGSEHGISWIDSALNETTGRYEYIASFRRVSADGLPLEIPQPFSNPAESYQIGSATLTWNGSEYNTIMCDSSPENRGIYFNQLVGELRNILISETVFCQPKNLSLQWTGSEFASAWMNYIPDESDLGIYLTRFLPSGELISHDNIIEVGEPGTLRHALVWTGSEFGLAWDDDSSGAYFNRLSAEGMPIDSPVRLNAPDGYASRPDLIWTGHEFGMVWSESRDRERQIYFTRISSDGILDPPIAISGSPGSSSPSLAWNNNNFGIAWMDPRHRGYEIYFTQVRCVD